MSAKWLHSLTAMDTPIAIHCRQANEKRQLFFNTKCLFAEANNKTFGSTNIKAI
jgi:hypothetical protein